METYTKARPVEPNDEFAGNQIRHVSHVRTQLFRRFAARVERELEGADR